MTLRALQSPQFWSIVYYWKSSEMMSLTHALPV